MELWGLVPNQVSSIIFDNFVFWAQFGLQIKHLNKRPTTTQ